MKWLLWGLALCVSGGAWAALLNFSADEVRRIARHGPWPPPPALDVGNQFSVRADVIALGRTLFFDKRLSLDGHFSCASCHQPGRAFSDGRRRALGRVELARNTPSLWNAAQQRWYGWDGASDSLWSQALRALQAPQEMAATAQHLHELMRRDVALARRFRAAFGGEFGDNAEANAVLAAKAIGAWVATLRSRRSTFDNFRDALQSGALRQASAYPMSAQRGLRLFVGRARCTLCHLGPLFTNGEFDDIGLPFFVSPGIVDPGRHGGIGQLLASPYNLLGAWSDDPQGAAAIKTRHVEPQHRNFGEFKVPSLRGVAMTAPYMHDGQLATLAVVVRHYSELNPERLHADGQRVLEPLHLSAQEQADLVAFLRTLSQGRR